MSDTVFPRGPAEALLDGIGEELNELCGLRMTRLTQSAAAAATTLNVERTYLWPLTGKVGVNGTIHTYSGKTSTSFTGLSPALPEALRVGTIVVDASQSYSALDLARQSMLVDYAEGEYLDALGRNYGFTRLSGMTDAQYRAAIKALAFTPKGTLTSIRTLLDLVLGAGNYDVFEDLINFPNVVFIDFLLPQGSSLKGKAFLPKRETRTSASTTTVVPTEEVGGIKDRVFSIKLAPATHYANFDVKPSAEVATPWTYTGTQAEGTAVTLNAGSGTARMQDTSGADVGAQYERTVNLGSDADGDFRFVATMKAVSATSSTALALRISNGERLFGVRWDPSANEIQFSSGGAPLGVAVAWPANEFHTLELRKEGLTVYLYVDGVLKDSLATSAFAASATRVASFGSFSTTGQSDSTWAAVELYTYGTINHWNLQSPVNDGTVNLLGDPTWDDALTAGAGTPFTSQTGRPIVVTGGTLVHGRHNGTYWISAVQAGGTRARLKGSTWSGLEVLATDKVRIPANHHDGFTAEDAGVQATRTTGTGTSGLVWKAKHGGVDGNQISVALVDPGGNNVPLSVSVAATDDITVTLATDGGGAITSTAAQVKTAVEANPTANALVDVTLVASPGDGVVVAAGAATLTGGEDGKKLTITGSTIGGNNKTVLIATLIDSRTVLLGSHLTPAALTSPDSTPALTLKWQKDPNFTTEANVEWEILGHGTASSTITFTNAVYASPIALELIYDTSDDGYVLADEFVANNDNLPYPFYLADPFGYLRGIIDALTVAGVIPKYR